MNINDNPTVNAILAAERITEGTHGRDNTSLFDPIWSPAMWERARISRHTASSAAFSSGVTSGRRRRLEVGGMAPSYRRADSLRTALTNPTTLIRKGSRHDLAESSRIAGDSRRSRPNLVQGHLYSESC